MPHPRQVPFITHAVIAVGAAGLLVLLLGLPVEDLLVIRDNPLQRVVVVTFALAFVGVFALAGAIYLQMFRLRQMEKDVRAMRELAASTVDRTDALAASIESLVPRVDTAIRLMEETMAAERERMRGQIRAYTTRAADRKVGP